MSERQRVIDTAKALPLLDGVFSLLLYNQFNRGLGPAPHAEPVGLSEAFPEFSAAQLAEAKELSARLLACAYEVGDRLLAEKFANWDNVMRELANRYPGFSQGSYEDTIHYGCFQAR